ncbi:hypothetical protein [Fodinicola feengrottensis]|uniref:hypothetical protein n=1 Tax=Fodinicola feengrottensis TaxID=435914 RepID=UPI0013D8BE50|nr:hypothetical protein [Fodinicola feengrottensis]
MSSVVFGIVNPGSAAVAERERRVLATVRGRQPGPQMVALIGAGNRVGTSTTAAGLALTLGALRRENVLLMAVVAGGASIGERLSGQRAPSTADVRQVGGGMVDPLMIPSGVHVIDAAPYNNPLSRTATAEMLDNSRNKYAFTVVDAATNVEDAGMTSIARADRVVVVTLGTPQGLGAAQGALGRLRPRVGTPMQPAVVLTVLLPPGGSRASVQSSADQLAAAVGGIAVLVPYDPALATGGRLDPGGLTPRTPAAAISTWPSRSPPTHRKASGNRGVQTLFSYFRLPLRIRVLYSSTLL